MKIDLVINELGNIEAIFSPPTQPGTPWELGWAFYNSA
jgi:hypothetical protein